MRGEKRIRLAESFHSPAYDEVFAEEFGGSIEALLDAVEASGFDAGSKGGALFVVILDDDVELFLLDCGTDALLWRFLYAGLRVWAHAGWPDDEAKPDFAFLLWDVVSEGDAFADDFNPAALAAAGPVGRSPELEAALFASSLSREPVLTGELAAKFAALKPLCEFEIDALMWAAGLVPASYVQ